MTLNSRAKGKRVELEAAKALHEQGFTDARRGQQFSGGADSPDIADAIPGVHIEVKGVEALNIWKAMKQSRDEAGPLEVPIVLFKRNRGEWLVCVPLDQVGRLIDKWVEARLLYDNKETK